MRRYRRHEGLPHQKIEEETLIVVPKRRRVHCLNAVGTRVWELLARPRSLEDLVGAVEREFEVDAARARADLRAYLRLLERKGLVARTT
jgi:hypothetical protein